MDAGERVNSSDKVKTRKLYDFIQLNEKRFELGIIKMSKGEFMLAVLIGIFANVFAAYLVAFDIFVFGESVLVYFVRLVVFGFAFYLPYSWYRKNTRDVYIAIDRSDKIYAYLIKRLETELDVPYENMESIIQDILDEKDIGFD